MKYVLITVMALLFIGCATTKEIHVKNSKKSNLNFNGDNVPVTVVVYKLRDLTKFKEASAFDLLKRDDALLGRDKIDSFKLQIAPDDEMLVITANKKDVPYIGVLAIFNDVNNKKLKSAIQTKKIKGKALMFRISDKGIFAEGKNSKRELIDGK